MSAVPASVSTGNGLSRSSSGVLGRGPGFWAAAFTASSIALGGLAFSGTIEERGTLLVLGLVPMLLLAAVIRATTKSVATKERAENPRKLAQMRYMKRIAIFTSLYLATFALMIFSEQAYIMATPLRVILALMPGLAVTGMFWAIGRLIVEETDEFLRMLTIRQTLIASGFALSLASIWGFLEISNLVPHLDAYWFAIAWFFGLIIGAVANYFQHGTMGGA